METIIVMKNLTWQALHQRYQELKTTIETEMILTLYGIFNKHHTQAFLQKRHS